LSDYRLFETDEFQQQLTIIASRPRERIARKLIVYVYPQLRSTPYFGPNIKKLHGFAPTVWRYRIGNYRVFYSVDDGERIVNILTIDDRKDAYR